MKRITDPTFRYTSAAATDIKKTFARILRERAAQKKAEEENAREAQAKVANMKRRTA